MAPVLTLRGGIQDTWTCAASHGRAFEAHTFVSVTLPCASAASMLLPEPAVMAVHILLLQEAAAAGFCRRRLQQGIAADGCIRVE